MNNPSVSSTGRLIIEIPTIYDFVDGSYTLNDVEAILARQ